MALKNITGAIFHDGVLISATWDPSEPRSILTDRSTSKNRYQVYPTFKDGMDGTGTFVELTISETYLRVALTLTAAIVLQTSIEGMAFTEAENKATSGRIAEQNRVTRAYSHEYTVETKQMKMVAWVEGRIDDEDEI